MPLDKMPDSEDFVQTHKSIILHSQGNPVACIVDDEDLETQSDRYEKLSNNSNLKAKLIGFLNKHNDLGLLMGLKLKIQTDKDSLEFTTYPNEEFIDTVIFNESISIINDKLDNLFSLRIMTDQFVKTRAEFEKFQNAMT